MEKTLAEKIEEAVTNSLSYSPIRDPSEPMRDDRAVYGLTIQEIAKRPPIEQTYYGLMSHLRKMDIRTGVYSKKVEEMKKRAEVSRFKTINNPNSVKLRVTNPGRYLILGRLN